MKTILKSFLAAAAFLAATVFAQPALYVEGTHYDALAKPVRTADPNKIEVTEVFWYGCGHCYAFEPMINSWLTKLPADVAFVRSPGMWNALMEVHAQIYFVEQALGSFDKTHKVVWDTIHEKGNYLQTQDAIKAMFVAQGIDGAAFDKAWTSFAVTSGVKQAKTRMTEYGIQSVPNLIVNGKYRVGANDAVKTQADMLKVVDFLVAKERSAK